MSDDLAKEAHHAAAVIEQLTRKLIKEDDPYLKNLGIDLRNTARILADTADYIREKHADE